MVRDEFLSERLRDEAVIRLKTVSGRTAADIGAGEGFISEGLLNAGLKVIAVEPSAEMVEFMRGKFQGIREFEILQCTPADIKLGEASVDYVFANMCLHHEDNPGGVVNEFHRILKTGGRVAVTDLLLYDPALAEGYQCRHNGFTLPDIYVWFINAGFRDVSVENAGCGLSVGEGAVIETFICTAEK